jgi:hypothetical protein
MPRCVHIDGEDRRVAELRQSFPPSTRLEGADILYQGSGRSRFMVVAEIGSQRSLEMARI